jgi:hypothetical protein
MKIAKVIIASIGFIIFIYLSVINSTKPIFIFDLVVFLVALIVYIFDLAGMFDNNK